jgi:hypothetical protein
MLIIVDEFMCLSGNINDNRLQLVGFFRGIYACSGVASSAKVFSALSSLQDLTSEKYELAAEQRKQIG